MPEPKSPVLRRPPARMVCWFDPGQLAATARLVAVSTLFGENADRRFLEALASGPYRPVDFSTVASADGGAVPREEITIDYLADTGDGWNSTYAVAYWITRPALTLETAGTKVETRRGDVLLFGGDQVYPTASRGEYELRLVEPFEAALSCLPKENPSLFVIPGNHDWYDSLVSFTRLFLSKKWFAAWHVPQKRSYFALKLPHDWWLVGTDVQLGSDIDEPQLEFFRSVAAEMGPNGRVILCNAEPHWVYAHEERDGAKREQLAHESNLRFLEENVFRGQIRVFLAGDLHHYRRHATEDDRFQKITAGGGGAFLHPTHRMNDTPIDAPAPGGTRRFFRKGAFPGPDVSARLAYRNLLFLFRNPRFGVLTGALYLLISWNAMVDLTDFSLRDWPAALGRATVETLRLPSACFWIVATFLGFILFTDARTKTQRFVGGFVHAALQLVAAFFIGWLSTLLASELGFPFDSVPQLLLSATLLFAGGWVVGSCIMGVYLLVALNGFGFHHNEAFSSLAIEDWKNFLRMRIGPDGELTIYPVGIERVPRAWDPVPGAGQEDARFRPAAGSGTPPVLIEPPVTVRP
jgi:hypothetical protein